MTMAFQSGPMPKAGISSIEAYVPGKAGPKTGKIFKLSANESPLGASPAALRAFSSLSPEQLELYPDGSARNLREAIAARYHLNADNIVCGGGGSGEVLQLLAQAYLNVGDEAIYSQYGFLVYPIAIAANNATGVVAPEHDFKADVGEILSRVTAKTKMVFLANPNNPTGTYLNIEEVKRLHKGLPQHVLLVLDGAYAEYVLANDYENGIALVESSSNVVMTRTFSKIFGLAGVRIGWAYCPSSVADILNRIRGPFNVGAAASACGIAAMQDVKFIEASVAHNARWVAWLSAELHKIGIVTTPSVANFVLMHFDSESKAADADAFLTARGLILRRVSAYGLPRALRLTVGSEEACREVIAALTEFMA
jgi:histidinol-phosphate aminotransferase